MSSAARLAWGGLGAVVIAYHVGLVFWGLTPPLVSRPVHMLLALPWVLIYAARTRGERLSGWALTALGTAACLYVAINQSTLGDQYGSLEGPVQHVVAFALITVVLEMARRAIGWPLPAVAVAALAYGFFGQHLPGEFGHPGLPVASFLGTMTVAEGGLWGTLTAVSVNLIL